MTAPDALPLTVTWTVPAKDEPDVLTPVKGNDTVPEYPAAGTKVRDAMLGMVLLYRRTEVALTRVPGLAAD